MGIKTKDLIELVIRPTLTGINWWSREAEQLLAGTCAQETQMGFYLHQVDGPALGIWQIESATHLDCQENYIRFDNTLNMNILKVCGLGTTTVISDDLLIYNLRYACCMARVIYLRTHDSLPAYNDIAGQADYWKTHYNSSLGKGDVKVYMANYENFVKKYYSSI